MALPSTAVYPLLQVNSTIFEEAGVKVPEKMNWDEFVTACEMIKAIGKTPIAVQQDWAGWFVRNAYLQCWENTDELNNFGISFYRSSNRLSDWHFL